MRWRVRPGDHLYTESVSSVASTYFGRVNVVYDDGDDDVLRIPDFTTNGARTLETNEIEGDVAKKGGWIYDGSVDYRGTQAKRGQLYVVLYLHRSGYHQGPPLARGYIFNSNALSLGQFVEPGPGGGEGFLSWVAAFAGDRAGNAAAVDYALAATNALRKVYGIAWYYHCSGDVASRTLNLPLLAGLGGTKPTGYTLTGNNAAFYQIGTNITLTADEEGAIVSYAAGGKDGRTVIIDNGALSVESTDTEPSAWPLWVTESDTDTIIRFPAITTGNANDTHSAYILIEEWLVF